MTIRLKPEILIQKISSSLLSPISTQSLERTVLRAIQVLRDKNSTVGFAESCTGGLLSSAFTKISGVSDIFMGSLVTYANYVKADILNVNSATIEKFGAVSAECAKEMSENALILLKVKYAVAITGIAGPQGGSVLKPVGTVFISVSGINTDTDSDETSTITTLIFQHDFSSLIKREDIQLAASIAATENLLHFINDSVN